MGVRFGEWGLQLISLGLGDRKAISHLGGWGLLGSGCRRRMLEQFGSCLAHEVRVRNFIFDLQIMKMSFPV